MCYFALKFSFMHSRVAENIVQEYTKKTSAGPPIAPIKPAIRPVRSPGTCVATANPHVNAGENLGEYYVITETHSDSELISMLDETAMWLVRGGLQAPVLAVVYSLRDALQRAHEEEMRAAKSVLVIVKTPVDEVAIDRAQMYRLWQKLSLIDA